jgi:hypothetical protein
MNSMGWTVLIEECEAHRLRAASSMVRGDSEVPAPVLAEGYEIISFRLGKDEEAWCVLLNTTIFHDTIKKTI